MTDLDGGLTVLGVVGAGAMGQGIAQAALTGGLSVILHDIRPEALARARHAIATRLSRLVEKGQLDAAARDQALERLTLAERLEGLADAEAVVEAVVEDLGVKTKVFAALEDVVGGDVPLASNTSAIPIARLAAGRRRRGRIAGMHFFNPVPVMKLVELVAAPETAAETLDRLAALAGRLGRVPVRVRDTPGFLVNHGGRAYITEALHIVAEGVATPAEIDRVMTECCGYPLGPFALMDLTGIDVNLPVTRLVHEGHGWDPRLRTTPGHAALLDAGLLGRKTGRGFYRYDEQGRRQDMPQPPPAPVAAPARKVVLLAEDARLIQLCRDLEVEALDQDDGESPLLIALPRGRDCAQICFDAGLDPARLVAVDTEFDTSRVMTLMTAPGADPGVRDRVAALIAAAGVEPIVIRDSAGFIAQRIQAMVGNLGCELAQRRLAAPEDIDRAMELGLNYPVGPLALVDRMGPGRVHDMLVRMQAITGDDRYRPSLWLRRRALLGLSALTPD